MTTETIRLDMTWRAAGSILCAVLTDGTPEGQASARQEIDRMASAADRARKLADLVAAIRESLRPVAEMNVADPNYVERSDMAETIAEAFALATGNTKA